VPQLLLNVKQGTAAFKTGKSVALGQQLCMCLAINKVCANFIFSHRLTIKRFGVYYNTMANELIAITAWKNGQNE
jgi:hypothetical protein